MKIGVGKQYRLRDKTVVKIIDKKGWKAGFEFQGKDTEGILYSFNQFGNFASVGESRYDIVEELKPEPQICRRAQKSQHE